MARKTQRWTPDTHVAVFETEWDDEDEAAPHVCIYAEVDGQPVKDPQKAYDRILAAHQAINRKRK